MRAQPRALLGAIPGLQIKEIAEASLCCGSAGVYNLLAPEPARELGQRKAANVTATGAAAAGDRQPGLPAADHRCAAPLRDCDRHRAHVEVLDASLRGLPADALLGTR